VSGRRPEALQPPVYVYLRNRDGGHLAVVSGARDREAAARAFGQRVFPEGLDVQSDRWAAWFQGTHGGSIGTMQAPSESLLYTAVTVMYFDARSEAGRCA